MAIEEKKWEPLSKAKWKRHNWIQKNHQGYHYELIIRDEGNRKIDRFVWNSQQKFVEILELLRLKFGLNYRFTPPT